ncbi:O-antigen ligase family protein [Sphingomonas sp. PB2P19]|uniref:O-antigen ligase family protein n=1 Tax=Sphingomonas rhamnosi TaxID=3096156 RepID=UPI002FC78BB9
MITGQHKTPPIPVMLAWLWLGCLTLFGGTAQARDFHNVILEVIAIPIGAFLLWRNPSLFHPRGIMIFMYAVVAVAISQIVPLPYSLWAMMPGHDIYADALKQAAIIPRARPWSLTPDLTLASLTGLIPLVVTVVTMRAMDAKQRRQLIIPVFVIVFLGAILGNAQMAQGADSPLRLYRLSTADGPVGFFSNRNHHALSLAMAIPLAVVVLQVTRSRDKSWLTPWLTLGVAALFALAVVIAGSRGALLIAIPGLAFLILPFRSLIQRGVLKRRGWGLGAVAVLVIAAFGLVALILTNSGRALSLTRLLHTATTDELRWRSLGPIWHIASAYFPFGSGFGSFDTVFRAAEPMSLLKPTYLNQAHNEPLQVLLEAGVPGIAIVVIMLIVIGRLALGVIAAKEGRRTFGFLGLMILVQLGLTSLADYPLRTPLLASLALVACFWLADASAHDEGAVASPSRIS